MKDLQFNKLGLLAIGLCAILVLSGCQMKNTSPESESPPESQGWVFIQSAEAVKPKTGIAREIKNLANLKIIGFVSESIALGYKYSDTVFGEDRGLCLFDVKTGRVEKYYAVEGTYFKGRLSEDRTQLAFTTDSSGGLSQLNVLNLETGTIRQIDLSKDYRENVSMSYSVDRNFSWIANGEGVFSPYDGSTGIQFSVIGKDVTTVYEVDGEAVTSAKHNLLSLSDFMVADQQWLGLISDGTENLLVSGELVNHSKAKVLEKAVVRAELFDKGQSVLWIRRGQNGAEDQLTVKHLKNGKNRVLTQMTGLQDFEISGDYAVLKQFDVEKGVSLYLIDLKTQTVSYVTTYLREGVGKVAVSPSGEQLSVDFEYQKPSVDGKPVSHLILLK